MVVISEQRSRFYLRGKAMDKPGTVAKVSRILGDRGISMSALLQHETAAGQFVPMVIITHELQHGVISAALQLIEILPVTKEKPVCIPTVGIPEK